MTDMPDIRKASVLDIAEYLAIEAISGKGPVLKTVRDTHGNTHDVVWLGKGAYGATIDKIRGSS